MQLETSPFLVFSFLQIFSQFTSAAQVYTHGTKKQQMIGSSPPEFTLKEPFSAQPTSHQKGEQTSGCWEEEEKRLPDLLERSRPTPFPDTWENICLMTTPTGLDDVHPELYATTGPIVTSFAALKTPLKTQQPYGHFSISSMLSSHSGGPEPDCSIRFKFAKVRSWGPGKVEQDEHFIPSIPGIVSYICKAANS